MRRDCDFTPDMRHSNNVEVDYFTLGRVANQMFFSGPLAHQSRMRIVFSPVFTENDEVILSAYV